MKRDHARQFLEQGLAELHQARQHLDYSFQQVAGLPESLEEMTAGQLESVEAFSRFVTRAAELGEMKDVHNMNAHDYAGAKAGGG